MKSKFVFHTCVILTFFILTGCGTQPGNGINNNEVMKMGEKTNNNEVNKEKEEPPNLTVTAGNNSIDAVKGTYSWNYRNSNGESTGVEADAGAPPELVTYQKEQLNADVDSEVTLNFDDQPQEITVSIWDDANRESKIETEGLTFKPDKKGEIIYSVFAKWVQGNAYFAVMVNVE